MATSIKSVETSVAIIAGININNHLEGKVRLCKDAKFDQIMVCTKWCCLCVNMPRGFSAKVSAEIPTSAYPLLLCIIVAFFSLLLLPTFTKTCIMTLMNIVFGTY